MSEEESSEMLKLLQDMKKQVADLQGNMDNFQSAGTSGSFEKISVEENDDLAGTATLVELSEETTAFLEAAFSTKLSNAYRKSG